MSIFNKKKYIAAISGGPDSMALLHMYRRHIKAVCTVKYNKRPDCQHDVDIVENFCKKHKIKFELLNVTEEMYENVDNNNFEAKARVIRYNFFLEICAKYNAKELLVAHHLDDFMETAYAQKKKGSLALFYGIQERSEYKGITVYRPLINMYRKATLQRYCDDYNLEYAIDSTNNSDLYERNRIRKIIQLWDREKIHDFLKEIDSYNKNNRKIYKQKQETFKMWEVSEFEVKLFKTFDSRMQYYLIYDWLMQNSLYRPTHNKIHGIIEFILGMNGKVFRLTDNLGLLKKNGHLVLEENNKENTHGSLQ
ncbi:tRNA lysidine(34) synthetase TilS [Ureaplasma ceti]|uniref:tRNA(Ile)-lysidine synthase n=1 Tax=Ureaplasma ceti TaxID=3119530 RepID=A0ABP9UDW3_9BACT